jgi:metal-sulfur cluster biosynthetic enzyme
MTYPGTAVPQPRAEDILESLTRVIARSFGANLYDLGFIYGIEVNHGVATVQMTLPVADHPDREDIVANIHDVLRRRHPGLEEIVIDFSFEPPWREDFITEAGRQQMAAAPLTRSTADGPMPDAAAVRDSLMFVIDPEVGINIVDLGLVYDVRVNGTTVDIDMTLTTPGCPLHETIASAVQRTLETRHPGIGEIRLELVWDPPWDTDMITDAGREQLGW